MFDPTPNSEASDRAASRYRNRAVNMMHQPLPPPLAERSDLQRIAAGSQFNGTIPNNAPGEEGSATPTAGGYWRYAGDVDVEVHFRTIGGAEGGGGRTAGSGVFVRRKNSVTDILLLTLTGANANVEYIGLTGDNMIKLNHGDGLKIITAGATLEMEAIIKPIHKSSRRGSF